MSEKKNTKEDIETLRAINGATRDLNDIVEELHEGPYEVELFVVKAKPGYPVVRYELRRKIG